MRLYPNLTHAVTSALKEIFSEGRYADKVLEKLFKQNPQWGARDRRFVAETTYDIVRWHRRYAALGQTDGSNYAKLLGVWCLQHNVELPDWKEFQGLTLASAETVDAIRAVRESIPDWLDALGAQEIGQDWDRELHALNEAAMVVLRANTLKITRAGLQKLLNDEFGIETQPVHGVPDALVLNVRQNIFGVRPFKDGLFEVQDAGSQAIAPFLHVQPGMRVIDACAGAGGKTLHLAALMRNQGRIIALDTEGWKLDELKKRAKRAGAGNIEARPIESSKTIKRLEESADRLLLDVPCSGLGVLRRNPDAKWKLSPEMLQNVQATQARILQEYSRMLKPGGELVYATCSILPSENETQVGQFVASNNDRFIVLEEKHILPSEGYDGFYMARLKKK